MDARNCFKSHIKIYKSNLLAQLIPTITSWNENNEDRIVGIKYE